MIHTADWHLGLDTDSIIDSNNMPSKLLDTCTRIKELIDYASSTNQSVIVAGDMFEKADPKSYVHAMFIKILKRFSERKVHVYFIPGNHDSDMHWTSLLVGQSALQSEYIHFILEPCIEQVEDKKLLFIPHKPRGSVTSFEDYIIAVKKKYKEGNYDFVISHVLVEGAVNISESALLDYNNALVFSSNFPKCSNYIFGHVHKHQILNKKDFKVIYPGSVIMDDFGERHDRKGFVEYREKKFTFVEFKSKVRDYVQINLNVLDKDTISYPSEKLKKLKGKIVKLVIHTDNREKVKELKLKELFSQYCYVSRFEVINDSEKVKIDLLDGDSTAIISNVSHSRLLKKWLGQQKEKDIIKELAYKIGKEVVECCTD